MKWVLSIAVFIVLASQAYAQAAETLVSPSDAWIGESMNITCVFNESVAGDVKAQLSGRVHKSMEMSRLNNTYFYSEYKPPETGRYSVRCSNGSTQSPEANFTVSRLETEILEYPEMVFNDEGIEIRARVVRNAHDREEAITSGAEFQVRIDGEEIGIEDSYYLSDPDDCWVIRTADLGKFGDGSYTLRLITEYDGSYHENNAEMDISNPLQFRILSISPDSIREGENISVRLQALYHNASVLDESSITAKLDGRGIDIKRTPYGFEFACPAINPETHNLEVVITYKDITASVSAPLYYMVLVKSEIRDAGDRGVSANIRFIGDTGFQKNARTNVNGMFSLNVPAGEYALEMSFPSDINIVAEGVDIREDLRDFVRFDTFNQKEIDGIRVARIFAFEFSPAFESMTITAGYDGSAIEDESAIEVYSCRDWNLDSRTCLGEWEDVDFLIDDVTNTVEFETTHLSSFVVGRRDELDVDFTLDRDEYAPGQNIKISGVVKNSRGKPVDGALVSYYIDGDHKGDAKSNSNGIFSLSIKAPSVGGKHEFSAAASKGVSRKDKMAAEFSVISIKEMSIIPPLKAEIREGSQADIEAVVINTGQEALEDCGVSLSGIPGEWYNISQSGWKSILPDQEKKVVFTISPMNSKSDDNIYTVNIDVACDGLSKSEGFVLYVNPMEEERESRQMRTGETSIPDNTISTGAVSAYFTGSTEGIINTITVAVAVAVLAFIIRKTRRREKREWLLALLGGIRGEVATSTRKPSARRIRKVM